MPRPRTHLVLKPCAQCGKPMEPNHRDYPKRYAKRVFCSHKCLGASQGTQTNIRGPYRQTKFNGKHISKHRAVMQQMIGRELQPNEHVHHINGNQLDNRPENLELLSPAVHGLRHQKHPASKPCAVCGNEFTPHKTKRVRQQTCGMECKRRLLTLLNKTRKVSNEQVAEIRMLRAGGALIREIGEMYGITGSQVSAISRGRSR